MIRKRLIYLGNCNVFRKKRNINFKEVRFSCKNFQMYFTNIDVSFDVVIKDIMIMAYLPDHRHLITLYP